MAARTARRKGPNVDQFILNCEESSDTEDDWGFDAAAQVGVVTPRKRNPPSVDLRASWWRIRNQKKTGACVGFATADGMLRWQYVNAGLIRKTDRPSPRFIWMADKETDEYVTYPTTFIEPAGTQTKLALRVARKYGCVLEEILPMSGGLSSLDLASFYTLASRLRIASFHNLGGKLSTWKAWIAQKGPVLTRLVVDDRWRYVSRKGALTEYDKKSAEGGHAVSLVGYTKEHFIVRNSWGTTWGEKGFAYASWAYARKAFHEAYGAVLPGDTYQLASS